MPLEFSSRRNFIKRVFYAFAALVGYRALPSVADESGDLYGTQLAQAGKKKVPTKKKTPGKKKKKTPGKKKAPGKKKVVKKKKAVKKGPPG